MRVLLDEQELICDGSSIQAAIDRGAARAQETGRLVVEVHVDGQQLNANDLDDAPTLEAAAEEVRMISAQPHAMVRQTLLDTIELLDSIDETQRRAAECIQADDATAGFEGLSEAIALWSVIQEAVLNGAQLLDIPLDDIRTETRTLNEAAEELNAHLTSLREALVNRDPVQLSDTLMYEMPNVIESWRNVLNAVAERAGSQGE